MRPADLSRMTGISRSNISQYLSGIAEPRRERLAFMARVLNVSLLWLLGADVPMDSRGKDLKLLEQRITALEKKVRIIKDSVNAGMRIEFKD